MKIKIIVINKDKQVIIKAVYQQIKDTIIMIKIKIKHIMIVDKI